MAQPRSPAIGPAGKPAEAVSGAAGGLDEAVENFRIPDSEIGEHLAVQVDLGALEPMDELAVAHSPGPAGGIDPDDPEPAPIAFFLPAVTSRVSFSPCASLLGGTQELSTATTEAFHSPKELVLLAQPGYAKSGSWHFSVLLQSGSQPGN